MPMLAGWRTRSHGAAAIRSWLPTIPTIPAAEEDPPRAFVSGCAIIFDRLLRMETISHWVEHEIGEPY